MVNNAKRFSAILVWHWIEKCLQSALPMNVGTVGARGATHLQQKGSQTSKQILQ